MAKKITYTIINNKGEVETVEKPVKEKKKGILSIPPHYFNLGFYLLVPLLGGIFIGQWLDKKFDTGALFTISLIIFGTIATFYNLIKLLHEDNTRNSGRNTNRENRKSN
jgi:F0F1-type ATP synthase assembly protein I